MRPLPPKRLSLNLPLSLSFYPSVNTVGFNTASNTSWFVMSTVASCRMPVLLQTTLSSEGKKVKQKEREKTVDKNKENISRRNPFCVVQSLSE